MPLNKDLLKQGIHQAFKKMQDTPAPENASPAELKAHFAQLLIDLSKDLSNSIDDYVRAADVVNVQTSGSVSLSGNPETVAIQTSQSNTGKLQ
jgi:hypothetical protein